MRAALLSLLVAGPTVDRVSADAPRPDIVLFILDDVGAADIDAVPTPNIDALAAAGASFRRAYAHAWCAPTRSSLLFGWWDGRYHGNVCDPPGEEAVGHEQPSLPKLLQQAGYATTLVGKWHLGPNTLGTGWQNTPHLHGFRHWRAGIGPSGECDGPRRPFRVDDGEVSTDRTHQTVQQRDAFIEEYRAAKSAGEPFFGVLAFTDAHRPWRSPPAELLPRGYELPELPTVREMFEAEVVALDVAIGEIMQVVGEQTLVMLFGDNGTPAEVAPARRRAKKSVFERGVRVPFVCIGPGVVRGERDALVHVVDVLPTLAERLELPLQPWMEGTSFAGVLAGGEFERNWTYVQNATKDRAVIERRWKLRESDGVEELYDLTADPGEKNPLAAVGPDAERLRAILAGISR